MSNGKQIIERLIAEAVAAHATCTSADDAWLNQLQAMRVEALRIVGDMNDAERAAADTLAKLRAELERIREETVAANAELAKVREELEAERKEIQRERAAMLAAFDDILGREKVA